ncbi:MAG: hypothetical protein FJ207_06630 [Gemmatimonadetes bacterium]|nr:hypothetical protein [Gemmatimonadota bacterium]
MSRSRLCIALLPFFAVGCIDVPSPSGPSGIEASRPDFELYDARQVMDARRVNVSVQGTFQVTSGTPPRVLGAGGRVEPANFPGHPPAGPGTCLDGRWFNARGHGTSGSMENPHPHCFDPGTDGITIVLEPISSQLIASREPASTTLVLSNLDDVYVHYEAPGSTCQTKPCYQAGGWGTVAAYAINAATNQRVGIIKFPLTLQKVSGDPFECTLDGDPAQTGCINFIYTASYNPLPPEEGGQGTPQPVTGFLHWFAVR